MKGGKGCGFLTMPRGEVEVRTAVCAAAAESLDAGRPAGVEGLLHA